MVFSAPIPGNLVEELELLGGVEGAMEPGPMAADPGRVPVDLGAGPLRVLCGPSPCSGSTRCCFQAGSRGGWKEPSRSMCCGWWGLAVLLSRSVG